MALKRILLAGMAISLFLSCTKEKTYAPAEPFSEEKFNIFPKPQISPNSTTGQSTGWVGDVMPSYVNGQFELFFLHDDPDQVKQSSTGQHAIHKLSSKNLLDFSYDGEMIPYGNKSTQDNLIGTGSMVKAGNTNYFYYTGFNANNSWLQNTNSALVSGNTREAIMYATSSTTTGWTKKPGFALKAPDGYATTDFRDPYVFYNTEFSTYWMMVSAQKDNKGVILVYTSSDPASDNWQLRGPLSVEGDYLMLECADVFKIDDKYFMLFAEDWSTSPGTHYRVASSSAGPWFKPADGMDMFDGHQFYAGKTASNGTERYAFGWAHRRNPENDNGVRTWGGNLISQQITKLGNDKLAVKAPSSVKSYFSKDADAIVNAQVGTVSGSAGNYTLTGTSSASGYRFAALNGTTMVKGKLSLSNLNGTASLNFNAKTDLSGSYQIRFEPASNRIAAYNNGQEVTRVPFVFEQGKTYDFSIIVDGSIIVLYLNDQVALTNRSYSAKGTPWSLTANGLEVKVTNLKVSTH
ncbi:glycoside hydrolase domain-containing protein [Pedobacter sp. WC2501]|uniref:glycoside hydrolase domain-containing protein n=1 Tax=Pedobacter sp. WC2501 TaxID=3461400 RepID=UPI0040460D53